MQFERLKKSHKKEIIIGAIAICVIGGILTFATSRAFYRVDDSIDLAKGTINYKAYDFKIMAMYKSDDKTNYTEIEEMPSEGYVINEDKSYCTTDNINQVKGKIKTINGNVAISNLNKNDKCFIWFDRLDDEKPIISNVTTSVTKTEINVTVTATDNIGVTEYWYQIDSNEPVKGTGNTYKFTGLSAGSTHTIKVYVKDEAENQSDTTEKSVTTTKPTGSETILANLGTSIKTTAPNFASVATTDEGVYATSDGMYGGTTYYWRGAATTNHVIFANNCWRIIRINGDKTIRLIYNGVVLSGNTCTGNGSNSGSIAITSQAYNSSSNRSEYVGWTYSTGSRRTTSGSPSNIKSQTDTWYNNNIGNNSAYSSHVADGKFCNDRNTASGYSWSSQPSSTFYYAGYDRENGSPTLSCSNSGDVYTLKAGAITMDEVVMAGGKLNTANSSYYLYNGQYYWTMSPSSWWYPFGPGFASVSRVYSDGRLDSWYVNNVGDVRPVINLKPDITFSSGNGTLNNPYVVS